MLQWIFLAIFVTAGFLPLPILAQSSAETDDPCKPCLSKAAKQFEVGDIVQAAEILQSCEEKCSQNIDSYLLLSNLLLRTSDLQGAEIAAKKAVALNPNLAAAHFQLGLALQARKNTQQATQEFEKTVALEPTNYEALSSLAQLYKELSEDGKALDASQKAATLAPSSKSASLTFLRNLIKQRKLETAKAQLKLFIDKYANDANFLEQLSSEAINIGAWDEAIKASQLGLNQNNNSVQLLENLSLAYYYAHDYPNCINTGQKLLSINSDNHNAEAIIALAYLDLGKLQEAQEHLEKTKVESNPTALSLLALGRWHVMRGDLKAADDAFGRSIAEDIAMFLSRIDSSLIYMKQGKWQLANDEATFYAAGASILSLQFATKAQILISQYMANPNGNASILNEARKLAEESLVLNPAEPLSELAMAKVEAASGNNELAKTLAMKVIDKCPGFADAYIVLARLAYIQKQNALAQEYLDKALSFANGDPEAIALGQNIKKGI